MAENIVTEDQVVQAAQELGQEKFTRIDLAQKLDVPRPKLKPGFRAAKESGRLEKTDETSAEGKPQFRLTGK